MAQKAVFTPQQTETIREALKRAIDVTRFSQERLIGEIQLASVTDQYWDERIPMASGYVLTYTEIGTSAFSDFLGGKSAHMAPDSMIAVVNWLIGPGADFSGLTAQALGAPPPPIPTPVVGLRDWLIGAEERNNQASRPEHLVGAYVARSDEGIRTLTLRASDQEHILGAILEETITSGYRSKRQFSRQHDGWVVVSADGGVIGTLTSEAEVERTLVATVSTATGKSREATELSIIVLDDYLGDLLVFQRDTEHDPPVITAELEEHLVVFHRQSDSS